MGAKYSPKFGDGPRVALCIIFCNQNADQLGSLAGSPLLTCVCLLLQYLLPVYVGVVECAPASLPPASSSLTHARRMDGFCNQNADQLGYLAGPSLLTVYVGVVECAPASLPTASSSLTHARRMDGFCNQNADQLGSLAGPSLLNVYVVSLQLCLYETRGKQLDTDRLAADVPDD